MKDKSESYWKKHLSQDEYYVLRQKGTERPFTGVYNTHNEVGIYHCKACHTPLFKSDSKFDAGCGWPSFDNAIDNAISYREDTSLKGHPPRVEILCNHCDGHLGHVFQDGPTDKGLRYCVNSISLAFHSEEV